MTNREIKFRAWDNKNKRWYFYDETLEYLAHEIQELNAGKDVSWKDITLEQFTGLYNKNGKEIYEGDIVKCNEQFVEQVIWKDGGFYTSEDGEKFKVRLYGWENLEIIGNIYENPELLSNK